MGEMNNVFPFSAIVGQELLKKALLLNAVNPDIGGVLIRGDRGTAKSTAVRSLAQLLPERPVSVGCPFGCASDSERKDCPHCRGRGMKTAPARMRVVDLPVSATEDKVVGTLDISKAIKEGEKSFDPGVLAEANGNILYVDEVNLLNDHVVDLLLDAAAMGVNIVEREGISYSHPSRFVLVGTMNPEEGELRPQLLDRFGLCVDVTGIMDEDARMEIARRRIEFNADPAGFLGGWESADGEIADRVVRAREALRDVELSEDMLRRIVRICIENNVDGHRADITMINASTAIAALDGRGEVTEQDVLDAAELVLPHRSKAPPKPKPPSRERDRDRKDDRDRDKEEKRDQRENPPPPKEDEDKGSGGDGTTDMRATEEFRVRRDVLNADVRLDDMLRESSGRRSETVSSTGRYTAHRIPRGKPTSVALDATIRAAAARSAGTGFSVEPGDVREKVRTRKVGNLIVFAVDASGSMGAENRMTLVKGTIMSLLTDAYQKRDKVCLITFRGSDAEMVLPPTNNTELAKRRLDDVPVGGKTPLGPGLALSYETIKKEMLKDREIRPVLVVVSDGRANSGAADDIKGELEAVTRAITGDGIQCLVIDSESGFVKLGLAKKLAEELGARCIDLESVRNV
ncbi:MAG: magnesium chelatase subunit D family protein [Thermoplasmatales archaeon]|nr:magnesium chelatase subunit D family protein [Thermoplasmatales archaeon]